jgi:hypothetical protein
LNDCATFVARDVRKIAALEWDREPAAFWIAKIRVRKNVIRRFHLAFGLSFET